jgi:hypothetical protein
VETKQDVFHLDLQVNGHLRLDTPGINEPVASNHRTTQAKQQTKRNELAGKSYAPDVPGGEEDVGPVAEFHELHPRGRTRTQMRSKLQVVRVCLTVWKQKVIRWRLYRVTHANESLTRW